MHDVHPVQVLDGLADLEDETLEGGQVDNLPLRQLVQVVLRVAALHELEQNGILLLVRFILFADIVEVLDDSRVAQLASNLELSEHAHENVPTQVVIVQYLT